MPRGWPRDVRSVVAALEPLIEKRPATPRSIDKQRQLRASRWRWQNRKFSWPAMLCLRTRRRATRPSERVYINNDPSIPLLSTPQTNAGTSLNRCRVGIAPASPEQERIRVERHRDLRGGGPEDLFPERQAS